MAAHLETAESMCTASVTLDTLNSESENEEFQRVFLGAYPWILEDCLEAVRLALANCDCAEEVKEEILQYYSKCLDYTVNGGKLTRGLTVLKGYILLEEDSGTPPNSAARRAAVALGWAIEMLQASLLVLDDVMDLSHTRRGQPCWFRLDHVTATNAVNDGILLENLLYKLLEKHCLPLGGDITFELYRILRDVSLRTTLGQHIDTNTDVVTRRMVDDAVDDSWDGREHAERLYTFARYWALVRMKTAYYSFLLPVQACHILARQPLSPEVKAACLTLGDYFQVQDDFLDCFSDPKALGKVGTDIADRKCSWLVCSALERLNGSERSSFLRLYAREPLGPGHEQRVKAVYEQLDLPAEYTKFEEKTKAALDRQIASVGARGPRKLLTFLLQKVYRRLNPLRMYLRWKSSLSQRSCVVVNALMATPASAVHRRRLGVILLGSVVLLWVGSSVGMRLLLFDAMNYRQPFAVASVSCAASLLLWVQECWKCRRPDPESLPLSVAVQPTPQWRDLCLKSFLLAPGYLYAQWSFNASLLLTSVSTVTVLSSASSVFAFLFSLCLLALPFRLVDVVGCLLAVAGSAVVVGIEFGEVYGDLLALSSAAAFGLLSCLIKRWIREEDVGRFCALVAVWNTLVYSPIGFVVVAIRGESLPLPSSTALVAVVVNAILATALGNYLWYRSVVLLTPTVASIGLTTSIPLSVLCDVVVFNERPFNVFFVLGAGMVMAGIVVGLWGLNDEAVATDASEDARTIGRGAE